MGGFRTALHAKECTVHQLDSISFGRMALPPRRAVPVPYSAAVPLTAHRIAPTAAKLRRSAVLPRVEPGTLREGTHWLVKT